MGVLIILAVFGIVMWFWLDSLRARERAIRVCKAVCRQTDTQLLDQTVSLGGLGIGRAANNRILLRRRYGFEFSTNGVNRWQGRVVLLGSVVESVQMDYPGGSTILNGDIQ